MRVILGFQNFNVKIIMEFLSLFLGQFKGQFYETLKRIFVLSMAVTYQITNGNSEDPDEENR